MKKIRSIRFSGSLRAVLIVSLLLSILFSSILTRTAAPAYAAPAPSPFACTSGTAFTTYDCPEVVFTTGGFIPGGVGTMSISGKVGGSSFVFTLYQWNQNEGSFYWKLNGYDQFLETTPEGVYRGFGKLANGKLESFDEYKTLAVWNRLGLELNKYVATDYDSSLTIGEKMSRQSGGDIVSTVPVGVTMGEKGSIAFKEAKECKVKLFVGDAAEGGLGSVNVDGNHPKYTVNADGTITSPTTSFTEATLKPGQKYTALALFTIDEGGEINCNEEEVNDAWEWNEWSPLAGNKGDVYYGVSVFTAANTNTQAKQNITVDFKKTITEGGLIQNALKEFVQFAVDQLVSALDLTLNVVNHTLLLGGQIDNEGLKDLWKTSRDITMILLIIAIVLISFANAVQFNIEKYNINRMIPRLFVSIGLVYISFFFIQLLLSIAGAMQEFLVHNFDFENIGNAVHETVDTFGGGDAANLLVQGLFLIILIVIVLVVMLYLWLILVARIVFIWFMTAIAPLAYGFRIMPFTEGMYMKWRDNLLKWIFMGPAVIYCLYFTQVIAESYFKSVTISDSSTQNYILLIMIAVGVFMSATIPLTLGGALMSKVSGQVKKYGKMPYSAAKKSALKQGGLINRANIPLGKGRSMGIGKAQYYWKNRQGAIAGRQEKANRLAFANRAAEGMEPEEGAGWRERAAAWRNRQITQAKKQGEQMKFRNLAEDETADSYKVGYGEDDLWKIAKNKDGKSSDIERRGALIELARRQALDSDQLNKNEGNVKTFFFDSINEQNKHNYNPQLYSVGLKENERDEFKAILGEVYATNEKGAVQFGKYRSDIRQRAVDLGLAKNVDEFKSDDEAGAAVLGHLKDTNTAVSKVIGAYAGKQRMQASGGLVRTEYTQNKQQFAAKHLGNVAAYAEYQKARPDAQEGLGDIIRDRLERGQMTFSTDLNARRSEENFIQQSLAAEYKEGDPTTAHMKDVPTYLAWLEQQPNYRQPGANAGQTPPATGGTPTGSPPTPPTGGGGFEGGDGI